MTSGPTSIGDVLGIHVQTGSSYALVTERSLAWAHRGESRTLCFSAVHCIMEGLDDPEFRTALNSADMINPDGMPVVWALRALGNPKAQRVYGPDATIKMLAAAERAGVSVGFYGGTAETMELLLASVRSRYPDLNITFSMSPPFRALSQEEDDAITQQIKHSETRILFVGLGCPKQEFWLAAHRDRIPAVMFAVGAAFDFLAGTKPQAPRWMMRSGLEWIFRLSCEPRRLAMRYLKHNPRFVAFVAFQWLFATFRR